MSGLENTVKRLASASIGKGYSTRDERRQKRIAAEQTRKDKMFAAGRMPDLEEVKRAHRRKAAKRRGSRIDTQLTERETLG